jgi:hypothetical protein
MKVVSVVGARPEFIQAAPEGWGQTGWIPEVWDGYAAERIVRVILDVWAPRE